MNKLSFCSLLILSSLVMSGCSTGNFSIKKKTGLVDKVNETNNNYKKINELFARADHQLEAGSFDEARQSYIDIQAIDATNTRAKQGLYFTDIQMRHLVILDEARNFFEAGEFEKAKVKLRPILIENPKNQGAKLLLQQIDEKTFKDQISPKKLNPKLNKTVTLEFKDASLVNIFQTISMATGVNFVLDPLVRQDLRASIFVKDAAVEDAINFLIMMHQLQKKVLTDTSVLVFPSNRASQYDDLIFRSFYLNHAEAKQLFLLIKQMIPGAEAFVDEKLNMITLKANYNQLKDVEKLIANEDIADPEVLLDVEVMEVKQSKLTDIGATLPTSVSLLGASPGSMTWNELTKVNGDNIKVSPNTVINLLRQDADTNVLANPRIRVRSREKAKIHIGDKIPIESTTTSGGGTAALSMTAATYLDVGLKLEVEPRVMLNNDVSIRLNLEVSNATLPAGAKYPTVNTRNTSTVLMTGDGETQVLAGLISQEDRKNSNKVAGLSELPLIGRLFTDVSQTKTKTEVILLITPHVVRNVLVPDSLSSEFYGGMGGRSAPINFNSNSVLQQIGGGSQQVNSGSVSIPQVIPQAAVISPEARQNQELPPPGGAFNPSKPVGY